MYPHTDAAERIDPAEAAPPMIHGAHSAAPERCTGKAPRWADAVQLQSDGGRHRERVSLQLSFGRDDDFTREWSLGDRMRRRGMEREIAAASPAKQ